MTDTDELAVTRDAADWLLRWFDIGRRGLSAAEQNREVEHLRAAMYRRSLVSPNFGGAVAVASASTALELLMLLADAEPAVARRYVGGLRELVSASAPYGDYRAK